MSQNPIVRFKDSSKPPEARLKVSKGPYKGAIYKLLANKITIGRSSDNDICFAKDEKCSRKQAILILEPEGYIIKDLSNKASLKVNNMVQVHSKLQDGDVIHCGSTVLQFECLTQNSLLPQVASSQGEIGLVDNPPYESGGMEGVGPINININKTKKKKSRKFQVILGVIVFLTLWLLLSDSQTTDLDSDRLATKKDIEKNIQTLSQLKEKAEKKRSQNMLAHFKTAQFAYIKGVRDYRKGYYGRAIDSFRVCKTLYPEHELCPVYLQKSQIKQQQLVQAWMVAGKDYREKKRFSSCMSSFKNVLTTLKDSRSLIYKEAKENYDICLLQHKDRY